MGSLRSKILRGVLCVLCLGCSIKALPYEFPVAVSNHNDSFDVSYNYAEDRWEIVTTQEEDSIVSVEIQHATTPERLFFFGHYSLPWPCYEFPGKLNILDGHYIHDQGLTRAYGYIQSNGNATNEANAYMPDSLGGSEDCPYSTTWSVPYLAHNFLQPGGVGSPLMSYNGPPQASGYDLCITSLDNLHFGLCDYNWQPMPVRFEPYTVIVDTSLYSGLDPNSPIKIAKDHHNVTALYILESGTDQLLCKSISPATSWEDSSSWSGPALVDLYTRPYYPTHSFDIRSNGTTTNYAYIRQVQTNQLRIGNVQGGADITIREGSGFSHVSITLRPDSTDSHVVWTEEYDGEQWVHYWNGSHNFNQATRIAAGGNPKIVSSETGELYVFYFRVISGDIIFIATRIP